MEFAVRRANRADLPAITALYAQHIAESIPGSFGDLQPVADWSFNDAFVAGLVDKPSGAFVVVTDADGVAIAMAIAYAHGTLSVCGWAWYRC